VAYLGRKKPRTRAKSRSAEVSFSYQILWGFIRLFVLALLILSLYYVTRLSAFTISNVTVQGGETISHDEIRSRTEDELQGSYLLIIPKRFAYLYPHDSIVSALEKNRRIHTIGVSRTDRKTLAVTFEEYIPHALWCMYGKDSEPCYFVDQNGYAFDKAPQLHGGTLTRHEIEGQESLAPGNVIDAQTLASMDTFIDKTEKELGMRITSVIHKKDKDYEFEVNGGGMIFASSGKELAVTFENLKSVLASKEFKHLRPGNFKYIDVRFDNKVFVNEELGTTTESLP
jgi:hypothetical protein